MKDRYVLALTIGLLSSSFLSAQVSFGGKPVGIKAAKIGLAAPPVERMPEVDVAPLMAEDEARLAQGNKGPYRFGYNHSVHLGMDNSGAWDVLPNGDRLWRLALECPGALSVNFVFDEYVVPEGARVFVYNDAGEVLGAFTAQSNPGHTELGVTQLSGERITVEYHEPAALAGQGRLHINQVTHAYRDVLGLMKGLGDSGACNNNVVCPEGIPWDDQIRSVAMITVGGSGICTGQLINNCTQDGTPYFLTANHCLSGGVGSWVFRFNWNSPTCATTTNGPTNQTVSGASLLVNSGGSDVALLELNSTPPASYNVFYTGWDKSGTAPTASTAIHHPSGDVKKISFDDDAAVSGSFGGAQCWRILNWEDGTTEGGSSGSGLWNQNGHLIGQLFGGQASCSNNVNDYYGKFDVSYSLLATYLGNCGNVLNGFDPNNVNPLDYDVAVLGINNVPDDLCNENIITPTINFKNDGQVTLTSVTFTYTVDGMNPQVSTWTGSLANGATANHGLPAITLSNGPHTLNVTSSAPNGQTDQNQVNDSRDKTVNVASPGQEITLNITLDDYGSETTWQLENDEGDIIDTGGPYQDNMDGTVESATWCLGDGCYVFTIFDDYGDGICCDYGNGDFEIVNAFGTVLVNGNGIFTDDAVENFCLNNSSIAEGSTLEGLVIAPNPSAGNFMITLPESRKGAVDLVVHDAVGRVVMTRSLDRTQGTARLELGQVADGAYLLEVRDEVSRIVKRITVQR